VSLPGKILVFSRHRVLKVLPACFFYLLLPVPAFSLDLEPRLWSHLPMNLNFGGIAYGYSEADIGFDPVLQLEDVDMRMHTLAAKYIRTFEFFGKSARVDITQGYQEADWKGLLDGVPGTASREGLTDTFVRFAADIYGAPPLKGKEYAAYRAANDTDTIVGAGLVVRLPTGNYLDSKLLNLGGNRFVFRPQLGISHLAGKWTTEVTADLAFYTQNDEFWDGNKREQDPLFFMHGHLIYTFRPGLWLGASVGFDYGGESKINGVTKDDEQLNLGWGVSGAYPVNRHVGVKFAYLNIRTQESTGVDSDSLVFSLSYSW
jgi:hypothetical protein